MELRESRKRPPEPLPEPLRAAELGTFTHDSVVRRLPDIGRQTIVDNDFEAAANQALEQLIEEIPAGAIRPLMDSEAPDSAEWNGYIARYEGQNWLETPWFFVETYFYRRVLEATGYFRPGAAHFGQDPFRQKKEEGLAFGRKEIEELSAWIDVLFQVERLGPEAVLPKLLAVALWGNQADLSLWPAGENEGPQHEDQAGEGKHLLVDDSALVGAYLGAIQDGRVDMVLDNAGFELFCDLCLTDFLLYSGRAGLVKWHLKMHPTFVSDATIGDVRRTLAWLVGSDFLLLAEMGRRLEAYLKQGMWQLVDHPFWTSPLPMWEMTADLYADLGKSDLIVMKGDANYRRLLGDRHWDFIRPFAEVVNYAPAPLLALRTLKSEVAVGITAEKIAAAEKADAKWMTDGKWGIIQAVI